MGQTTAAAVTSCTVAAATCAFAWALARWVENGGLRYEVPLVAFGTVWILTVTFAGGVSWTLGQEAAKPRPPTPPGPTPPPDQPGETPRPAPGPIQPPRPRPGTPPPSRSETTLVDLAPVSDVTQEIPLLVDQFKEPVGYVRVGPLPRHVPPEQLLSGDWRPRVSADTKGEDQ